MTGVEDIPQLRAWARDRRELKYNDWLATRLDDLADELETQQPYLELASAISPELDADGIEDLADLLRKHLTANSWAQLGDSDGCLLTGEQLQAIATGQVAAVYYILATGEWNIKHVPEATDSWMVGNLRVAADYYERGIGHSDRHKPDGLEDTGILPVTGER